VVDFEGKCSQEANELNEVLFFFQVNHVVCDVDVPMEAAAISHKRLQTILSLSP